MTKPIDVMKRILLSVFLSCFALASLRADLIWYEGFNYPDGPITNTSGGIWIKHGGGSGESDAIVRNNQLEVSTSGVGLARQDDVIRPLCVTDCLFTNNPTYLYASLTINFTNLPTANGQYFAHFFVTNFIFQGRLWALTGNPTGTSNVFSALPGTYRLGVSAASGLSPSAILPLDLALNTTYQVVLGWDPVNLYAATVWVNPISEGDLSVTSNDAVTPGTVTAFGFRQATGFGGFLTVSNLAVATSFAEAAENVWNTSPLPPVIVYQPASSTNFAGSPVLLSAVAAGQGQGGLTYEWLKNGSLYSNPDGNTNVLFFPSASVSDSGLYQLVATTPHGLSATSAVANLWVTNPAVPPTITVHPTNRMVNFGQTATFAVAATGPGTLTYQWNRDGVPIPGETNPLLTIPNVQTNNNTTGTYNCGVTNEFGGVLSSNAVLTAVPVPLVSIAYLRTLVDPVFFLPTNTTALWSARGIVTTHSRLTGGNNTSFFFQDETAGMGVFIAGGAALTPAAGDRITVTGPLSAFNGGLQFNLSVTDPASSMVVESQNHPLPPGIVLPFSFTNGVNYGGLANVFAEIVGSVVTFTNVYFSGAGNLFAGGNATDVITNLHGESFRLFRNTAMTNLTGLPIPARAWTVSGVMGTFLQPTNPDRGSGFQLFPTVYSDIVTNAPPAVTGAIALTDGAATLNWIAQPYMSYTILRATNVEGPYIPWAGGLTFNSTAGQFTDTNAAPATRFYRILSP